MKTIQDKRSDFKRLLVPRLEKAIRAIKVIGNLSANQYAYTEGEAEKVIQALRLATDQIEAKFFKKDESTTSEFIDYVWEWYGPNGLYPIEGLTKRMVEVACRERTLAEDYCDGDSEDREQVMLKIVKNYGLMFS